MHSREQGHGTRGNCIDICGSRPETQPLISENISKTSINPYVAKLFASIFTLI